MSRRSRTSGLPPEPQLCKQHLTYFGAPRSARPSLSWEKIRTLAAARLVSGFSRCPFWCRCSRVRRRNVVSDRKPGLTCCLTARFSREVGDDAFGLPAPYRVGWECSIAATPPGVFDDGQFVDLAGFGPQTDRMRAMSLVGRDRLQARFCDAVTWAVAGAGGVVLVRGDPGIGKSALVAAGLDMLEVSVFVGSAVPGASPPGRAVAEIAVAAVAAGARLDDPTVAVFRRVLENLVGPPGAADAVDGVIPDGRTFGRHSATAGEGLLRLLALVPGRPVAVIEDLQWVDPDTVSTLEYVAGHLRGRRAALVATMRTGENGDADALAVRLGRAAGSTTTDVPPLRLEDVQRLTIELLGGGSEPVAG